MGVIFDDSPGIEHQVRDLSDCFVIDSKKHGSLFFKGIENMATHMGVSTIQAWTYVARGRWNRRIVRRATLPEIRAVYPDYRVKQKVASGTSPTTPMPVTVEWEVNSSGRRRPQVFIHYFPSMRMACASLGISNQVLRALHGGQVPPWKALKKLTIQAPGYTPPRGHGWHLGYMPGSDFFDLVAHANGSIAATYKGPSRFGVFDEIPIHVLKLT